MSINIAGILIQPSSSGALVLSNGDVCIDEFDKVSDATRSILHEVMVSKQAALLIPSYP